MLKNKTWEKLKKIKGDKKKAEVRVERTERKRRMKDKTRIDKIGWTKSRWTF